VQSTGVYWIPLYEILDARGLEVYLVNARHTKNLPGRKSDVQESQWLLKLHTYGRLRNSFHPPAEIRVVRTYWRQRGDHVHAVSTCIQRMQKALTQMNIQLANVISDLSGGTGQRIVRAMLAGERDPEKLAALSHPGIHATRQTIARSLEGTWQPDLLFVLQQEVAMCDAYLQRIAEYDQALEQHLKGVADKVADTLSDAESQTPSRKTRRSGPKRCRKAGSHAPQFDLGRELHRISGVDLTRIDGIDVGVAQTVISEVGLDMTRWNIVRRDRRNALRYIGISAPAARSFSDSGISVMVASVSSRTPATDMAFSSPMRTTLVGSMMPASTRSTYSFRPASNP